MTADWTIRITASLALALAAGCTASADLPVDGSSDAAFSEEAPRFSENGEMFEAPVSGSSDAQSGTDFATTTGPAPGVSGSVSCYVPADAGPEELRSCLERTSRGGTVELGPGEFRLSESVRVGDGVEIRGQGPATVITVDGGFDQPVFTVGSLDENPTSVTEGAAIRDLAIFGSGGDQTTDTVAGAPWIPVSGIVIRAAREVSVEGVIISETASSGVMVDAGSESVMLRGVSVVDAMFDGITVQASENVSIERATLMGNEGAGISFDWGVNGAVVRDSVVSGNGSGWGGGDNPGIYMAMTFDTTVESSEIVGNDGNGIVLTNQGMATDPGTTCSSDNTFDDNEISSNGQFAFWLTHGTCTGNRANANVLANNAWGPIFEPVSGQLAQVDTVCQGNGCTAYQAD